MKMVNHPAQQGRHASTQRLLWWLIIDLVIMGAILVWYFATYRANKPFVLPTGITASADTNPAASNAVGTVQYGVKTTTP